MLCIWLFPPGKVYFTILLNLVWVAWTETCSREDSIKAREECIFLNSLFSAKVKLCHGDNFDIYISTSSGLQRTQPGHWLTETGLPCFQPQIPKLLRTMGYGEVHSTACLQCIDLKIGEINLLPSYRALNTYRNGTHDRMNARSALYQWTKETFH